MGITPNTEVVHLPFGAREAYGAPYPEGIAVGHIDAVGDATGGAITASFTAPDQFLYRLEVVNATSDDEVTKDVSIATVHEWATAQSGFSSQAFTLNWQLSQVPQGGFSVYTFGGATVWVQIRRFPIGAVTPSAGQFIAVITVQQNVDLDVWDFDVVFSYWPKTALYLPGFLSSFYEAPEVAPPVI